MSTEIKNLNKSVMEIYNAREASRSTWQATLAPLLERYRKSFLAVVKDLFDRYPRLLAMREHFYYTDENHPMHSGICVMVEGRKKGKPSTSGGDEAFEERWKEFEEAFPDLDRELDEFENAYRTSAGRLQEIFGTRHGGHFEIIFHRDGRIETERCDCR